MRSIIHTDNESCFICRSAIGTETHHIFGGQPNRSHSDDDGLVIRICRRCHDEIHHGKNCKDMMDKYHKLGQTKWEAFYGPGLRMAGIDPREKFRERYGKSWL